VSKLTKSEKRGRPGPTGQWRPRGLPETREREEKRHGNLSEKRRREEEKRLGILGETEKRGEKSRKEQFSPLFSSPLLVSPLRRFPPRVLEPDRDTTPPALSSHDVHPIFLFLLSTRTRGSSLSSLLLRVTDTLSFGRREETSPRLVGRPEPRLLHRTAQSRGVYSAAGTG